MAEPSVNPNALGAPAEGFGQTVSFAYDPRGTEPPMQRVVQSQGPRTSVQGGGSPVASRVDPNSVQVQKSQDPTASLLMKVGGDMLAARIDEARTTQYVQGMQQAMSGKGIQEVKESQPWYTKLFGDTPVIEGARAYSAQDTVNRVVTDQVNNMDSIMKLGPREAADHFNKVLQSSMTGGSQTDAVIMKGLGEQLPSLMKAQAKANVGYTQGVAARNLGQSIASGASQVQAYGKTFAADGMSPEDFKVVQDKFVASVLPPAGINEESYQKTLTSSMLGMAQRGEFHALEALRSTGVQAALTGDQALRIEAATTAAAKRHRDNYALQYIDVMSEIESDAKMPPTGSTVKQLKERIERANGAFTKSTGNPSGLWSSDQVKDMLEGSMNAFKQNDKEAARNAAVIAADGAKADAKAAAKAANDQIIQGLVSTGNANLAKKMDGIKSDDVDLAVFNFAKNPDIDPASRSKMLQLNWSKGHVSQLLSDELQSPMKMAAGQFANGNNAPPDGFFQSVQVYRAMEQQGGSAYANAYFGDHAMSLALASKELGTQLLGNPNGGAIYARAMAVKDAPGERMDKKEREGLVKKVISEGNSWLPRAWGGGTNLRPDAARRLAEQVETRAGHWKKTGKSDEESTAMALSDVLGPKNKSGSLTGGAGAEILGGFMIARQPGASVDTLSTIMEGKGQDVKTQVPEDIKDEVFKDFMTEHVRVPNEAGTVDITRAPDAGGTPRFNVSYVDKDGVSGIRYFSGADLAEYSKTATKWKRMPRWTGARGETTEETAAYNSERVRMEATPVQPIQTTYGPAVNYTPENQAKGVAIARQQVIDSMKTKRK